MKVGESEAFGVFDQHDSCVWDVDPNLDHCRADERLGLATAKSFHNFLLFRAGDSAMEQLTRVRMEPLPPSVVLCGRRLCLELFAFVDQWIDHVNLTAGFELGPQKTQDLAQFRRAPDRGNDFAAARSEERRVGKECR